MSKAMRVLPVLLLLSCLISNPLLAQTPSVVGFVDTHSHPFSNVGFGGRLVCGKVFDPDGIDKALVDCPNHYPDGSAAIFENFFHNGSPLGTHDPVGWPTFAYWPAHNSLTHQQVYYEWLQRAWKGGLRIFVNQLVANRVMCILSNTVSLNVSDCSEQTQIQLEAKKTYELQDYIDSLNGGPGKGWLRIVTSPAQARAVIAQGKLAMVLGIESSEIFGCKKSKDLLELIFGSSCTKSNIDKGLQAIYDLGVRSLFLCHKFDNALCGVRFDPSVQGVIVNAGNFLSAGSFWQAQTCAPGTPSDNTIAPNGVIPGFLSSLVPALPLYPPAPHCNVNGLTDLGKYALQGMINRHMLVEIDHMSVKAAAQVLATLEAAHYPGVISGHSWMDPRYYPRVYNLGGFVGLYGTSADQFANGWRDTAAARRAAGIYGLGYGLDANGLGEQPAPRPNNMINPVVYPFTTITGLSFDRLSTGQRNWDINTEGVANYGLTTDWIEDMRHVAGNDLVDEMAAGAEAYLRTWEGAVAH